MTFCKHCRDIIVQGESGIWAHYVGEGSILVRCNPGLTGQPYGLEATPEEQP